jgi:hypothetical protein
MTHEADTGNDQAAAADRLDVQDTICAMTLYADLGNLKGAASLFAEGATLDYSSLSGPQASALVAKDFWVGVEDFFPGFDATQHMITNFAVQLNGMRAECTSAVRAMHRIGQEVWTNGGFYYHRLVKVGGHWRIAHLRYDMRFEEGRSLVEDARRRVESGLTAKGTRKAAR